MATVGFFDVSACNVTPPYAAAGVSAAERRGQRQASEKKPCEDMRLKYGGEDLYRRPYAENGNALASLRPFFS